MAESKRLRDLGNGRRDAIMLDPRIIEIEKDHNPRDYRLKENRDHLDELKASIRERGVLQPLLVRYEVVSHAAILVDGECRLRACLELIKEGSQIDAVPTIQVQAGNETERLVLAITANTGKPLSKWEIGIAFKKLANFGWESSKIAKELGFSERFITEAIELTDAPEDVKNLLSEGAVTPSLVRYHMNKRGGNLSLTIRDEVEKAKSRGKKTAKRTKKAPRLVTVAKSLFADDGIEKIKESDAKFWEVDRKKLLRLWELVSVPF